MPEKTLTTEAKIRRIQQLMRQHQPTSKLYQSMAPQLQTLMAQFKAEQQEAARLKAIEVEQQKAEAEEKKRQAAIAAAKAKAEAEAKAKAEAAQLAQLAAENAKAAAEENARQAESNAEKAQASTATNAEAQPTVTAQTKGEPRLFYHARGCLKATYTDGKLLWQGYQLDCWVPHWLALKEDVPLYVKVYPIPRKINGDYRLKKFRVYAWSEQKPKNCEDGQFYLGGCWIYKNQAKKTAQQPIFRVYRNRRTTPRDPAWPLNLKLHWPEQEPSILIPKKQPGWKEQDNFYEIKADYDPEQQALIFTKLLSGPSRMPVALNYYTAKKKKKKKKKKQKTQEGAPMNVVEEAATADKPAETAMALAASQEETSG